MKYVLSVVLLFAVALYTAGMPGCSLRPASTADGSEWRIIDGKQVKVKSWDHDENGNRINFKDHGDDATPEKREKPDAAQGIYQTGAFIGTVSRLLILLSAASLVASYWIPWLPKGAAWKGFAVAAGLIVGQYWIVAYGVVFSQVAFWVTIAAVVGALAAVGYPWLIGLRNRQLVQAGLKLAASGDPRAGAALIISGSDDTFKTPADRKSLLTSVTLEAQK